MVVALTHNPHRRMAPGEWYFETRYELEQFLLVQGDYTREDVKIQRGRNKTLGLPDRYYVAVRRIPRELLRNGSVGIEYYEDGSFHLWGQRQVIDRLRKLADLLQGTNARVVLSL